jgi:hypothetical protein
VEISTGHDSSGRERVTITYAPGEDDPSGTLGALVAGGRLEEVLRQIGRAPAPATPGEAERGLEAVRDLLGVLEPKRRALLVAGRSLGLSWGQLGRASGTARQTVKRWVQSAQAGAPG